MTTAELDVRPVHPPSALGGGFKRFLRLTWLVAKTDFKLTYYGSVLGYLWSLMQPLLFFGVLYVMFALVLQLGKTTPYFPVILLMNIVLFSFFQQGTGAAIPAVVQRENLVRKMHFPRMVIPLSIVLGALFNLALNLVVVFVFAVASGATPMLSWLELPLIVVVLAVFATGLAMLLSSLYVYFRDVAPIWDVVQQIVFYASPVIVPLPSVQDKLSPTLLKLYMLNPLATVFQEFRHAIINHATVAPESILGVGGILGVFAIAAAMFALGFVVFNRTAPYVAENL